MATISAREARRKKILERGSDRLALITGQIHSFPPDLPHQTPIGTFHFSLTGKSLFSNISFNVALGESLRVFSLEFHKSRPVEISFPVKLFVAWYLGEKDKVFTLISQSSQIQRPNTSFYFIFIFRVQLNFHLGRKKVSMNPKSDSKQVQWQILLLPRHQRVAMKLLPCPSTTKP